MIRFIFACMLITAGSLLAIAAQPMIDGVLTSRQDVVARNNPVRNDVSAPTVATGPDFTQIYAMAAEGGVETTGLSPEELNRIGTAAGGEDRFMGGFTNMAPSALADETPPLAAQTIAPFDPQTD